MRGRGKRPVLPSDEETDANDLKEISDRLTALLHRADAIDKDYKELALETGEKPRRPEKDVDLELLHESVEALRGEVSALRQSQEEMRNEVAAIKRLLC